jgi:hypothetical protein
MWEEKETDELGNVQRKVDHATKENGVRDFEGLTAMLLQI